MYKKMRLFSLVLGLISVLLLSACTNSVEFTINFDSNGGSEVSSIKTDGTSSITLPNDPIKDGYSFAGWYWDNGTFRDLFTVNSLLERGISGNLTVYAKWNEEDTPIGAIKVTFNSMGGSEVNPQYVQKENTIAIPNTSKVGYTFGGWYSDSSLTTAYTFTTIPTQNITLYAKWIIIEYTITLHLDGGVIHPEQVSKFTILDEVNLLTPTKEGFKFLGWSTSNTESGFVGKVEVGSTENKSFYAKWESLGEVETLSKRQSINEYEVSQFGMSGLPSTGTYDVLVVPVEIQNVPFEASYITKLDKVFNGTSLDTGWESVASYYYKSSFGLLDLNFDILDKHITSNVKSYYEGKGQDGDQHAILDALTALDSTIDFSKYDANNDGVIDSIIFIYSTDYNYDVDPWWAWVYVSDPTIVGSVSELDGKNFEYYFWASYEFINDSLPGNSDLILNSETYIHELGHLMGILDFYPYDGNNQYGPMGGFDMMDYNAGDHGPFNKLVFGWLQPLIAQKGTYQVTLDSYSTDTNGLNNTLLIPFNSSDLNDGNAFDEYLLVMFYTPNGLYSAHSGLEYIPSNAGIVVYHIDARLTSNPVFWGEYFINDNEGSSSFINQILEADKNNSIPGKGSIKQSDLLTSGTLNLNTYSWNQGGKINVSLTVASLFNNISEHVTLTVTVA